jgi:hypothetical protein
MSAAIAWSERPSGFSLATGAMKLAVTDQSDRGCGWCWHVQVDHDYGSDQIGCGGGLQTCDAAKAAGIAWARAYCETTLAALAAVDPATP